MRVALSSAEAELNASVKVACEAPEMKQMCIHLGMLGVVKMIGDELRKRRCLKQDLER